MPYHFTNACKSRENSKRAYKNLSLVLFNIPTNIEQFVEYRTI